MKYTCSIVGHDYALPAPRRVTAKGYSDAAEQYILDRYNDGDIPDDAFTVRVQRHGGAIRWFETVVDDNVIVRAHPLSKDEIEMVKE